jgi:hypothetical protein
MILRPGGGTPGAPMYRCRVACRVASRLTRQNACPDAVNAPSVETKVLHPLVHPFPMGGWSGRMGRWSRVGDERGSLAGRYGDCPGQVGGVLRAYPERPSRRVAYGAPRDTFLHSIAGNERKKVMVPE